MRSNWISAGVSAIGSLALLPFLAGQMPGDKEIWEKDKNSDTPLFRFVVQGKAGYINIEGRVVIQPQFRVLGDIGWDDFHEGIASAGFGGRFWVNEQGKELEPLSDGSERTGKAAEGMIRTYRKLNGSRQEGFVDFQGRRVIPEKFEGTTEFSEGLAAVRVGGLWGYIDKSGAFAIAPRFLEAEPFSEGAARVIAEGPCMSPWRGGCIIGGVAIGAPEGTDVRRAKFPGCRYSYIDKSGVPLFETTYGSADNFSEGLARVSGAGGSGFIDKTGTVRIPLQFRHVRPFSDGMARFLKGRDWGYMDKAGREVFPAQFEYAQDFSEGAAVVGRPFGAVHFIDKGGRKLFDAEYTRASGFRLGLAHVCSGHDCAYIDRTGQAVFRYQSDRE
ncbi:WG repeat-containing protein [Paludibaculum fermentans]|uniref:WG repeat-containing protein n=1 Tax=Paludibaculum fermentans TaxID=1473598 RepID=A0A7S7NUA1_PALFE|nr:WG repeat-containing protein [Paludibaculum fermentans]QOY89865.1 WG repeat-containing protein [Paludibaculum fermentans]